MMMIVRVNEKKDNELFHCISFNPSAMKQLRSIEREEIDKMRYINSFFHVQGENEGGYFSINVGKRRKVQLSTCNTCEKKNHSGNDSRHDEEEKEFLYSIKSK